MSNWQTPLTAPASTKGYICYMDDDGLLGVYTHWLPLLSRKHQEYSSWNTKPLIPLSPCLNTGRIDDRRVYNTAFQIRMSHKMIREVAANGHDVFSHGHYHISYEAHALLAAANAGATVIRPNTPERMATVARGMTECAQYMLYEGTKQDVFTITSIDGSGNATITPALSNSYTTAARVRMTDESASNDLMLCINYLHKNGYNYKHNKNPFTMMSDPAREIVEQLFDFNGREFFDGIILPNTPVDRYKFPGDIGPELTEEYIDNKIAELVATGGLWIPRAHGETTEAAMAATEYMIDKALEAGVRFISISECVKLLESWGSLQPSTRKFVPLLGINATMKYATPLLDMSGNDTGVKVRRSSDNTEMIIPFVNRKLDVETLMNFVGDGNGFIKETYSGNTISFSQTDPAAQPLIVSNGEYLGCARFTGAQWLDSELERIGNTGLHCANTETFTVIMIMKSITDGTILGKAGATGGSRTFQYYYSPTAKGNIAIVRGTTTNTMQCKVTTVTWDGTKLTLTEDGYERFVGVGSAAEETTQKIVIGARTNGTALRLQGDLLGVVIVDKAIPKGRIELITSYIQGLID